MRFNLRTGNYAQAGQAAAEGAASSLAAVTRKSTDFGKLVQQAQAIRSEKKKKATEVAGNATVAGINAARNVETRKIDQEAKRGYNKARRKAGALGVAGQFFTTAGTFFGEKRDKREIGIDDPWYQKRIERAREKAATTKKQAEGIDITGKSDMPSLPSSAPSAKTGESTSSGTATGAGTGAPTTGFRSEVYSYLTNDKGLDQNQALGLMANIDRESSFRINPQGGDGGNSFGMFQWNNAYGRSDIMKQNVSNWQTNWKGQIDHALSGNQLPEYNTVTSKYLNTKFNSPQEASEYWLRNWERPAHVERDIQTNNSFLQGYSF